MEKKSPAFSYLSKSKFVRSLFGRVLAVFLVVSIAIVVIVFNSFADELSRSIVQDRQKQLAVIEDAISTRMEEISSIAYNIGADTSFFSEPVEGSRYSGYEMANTLSRYLVGNSFIEHLAYYRLSEPDKIYTARGELSFADFWCTYLNLDEATAAAIISEIRSLSGTHLEFFRFGGDHDYFCYTCSLPQFSAQPQSFVLIMIPLSSVQPLLESQLLESGGAIAVFDAGGNEIYRLSTLDEEITLSPRAADAQTEYKSPSGEKYLIQRQVANSNGWTYISALRTDDAISGLAMRQMTFILMLLLLMFVAVVALLIFIVIQYKPISDLAAAAAPADGTFIDERELLASKFATLQDESDQKQRFETAFLEAESANKAKSAFLSSMSHDIRTPMNAIVGLTAMAAQHADEPDYVRDCLQKVQVSSTYLLDIINNVLDMSRIESGRFTLADEVVDLPRLIDHLHDMLEQSVADKNQHFTVQLQNVTAPRVRGDSVRLTQICMNILSNAVKFTPVGGEIELILRQTECDRADHGAYTLTFRDTGVGMPANFVAQVFDAFTRADNVKRDKSEGTGLGMAIAKNLVCLMGGSIRCQSELGKGTIFTVELTLPLAAADAPLPQEAAAPSEPPTLAGHRVLLAEDNAINREVAHKIISETGAEIVAAVNGQEAVNTFADHDVGYFDVILMDLQMPVMDGYEATAAIRALPRDDASQIPIYALTANAFAEDVRRVHETGMNGHISKPYTPAELYRVLVQALQNKQE